MRFVWKDDDGVHRAEAGDKTYQVTKSSGGAVWELHEVLTSDNHNFPRGMTHRYLTNAKSLAIAKKIASDLHRGKVYLDEDCVPRKVDKKDKES